MTDSVCAVIMAAGKGTRMGSSVDKPLVKLGSLSMVEHSIYSLASVDRVEKIFIISSERSKGLYEEMAKDSSLKIGGVVVQKKTLGTFHAVEQSYEVIKDYGRVIITSGDNPFISPRSFNDLLDVGGNSILGLHEISNRAVFIHNEGILDHVVEDYDKNRPELYSTLQWHMCGVYCVVVDELIRLRSGRDIVDNNDNGEYYLPDIFPLLRSRTEIVDIKDSSSKMNINDKTQLEIATEMLHSRSRPFDTFSVTAHGRVNLMGRHVDHQGGYNNPILIGPFTKVTATYASLRNPILVLRSRGERSYIVNGERPKIQSNWTKYIVAPLIFLQDKYSVDLNTSVILEVESDIPQGCGLSSSSALVVAAMKIFVRLLNLNISTSDLIEHCGLAEKLIGTNGGYGDHAAIISGSTDRVVKMLTVPEMKIEDSAELPSDLVVYVYDSGVRAEKGQGDCNTIFNSKVKCYEDGFKIISPDKRLYLPDLDLTSLETIEDEDVRKVMMYGIREYERSDKFIDSLSDLEKVREMVRASMKDEQTLYGCSCPEVDYMVSFAESLDGVYGAQICGAGMGGCVAIFAKRENNVEYYFKNYTLVATVGL